MQAYTKTVFIPSSCEVETYKKLKVGQWICGITFNGKPLVFRGQFMGFDHDGDAIVNFRNDTARRPLSWREQFASNKPLREFARIKG